MYFYSHLQQIKVRDDEVKGLKTTTIYLKLTHRLLSLLVALVYKDLNYRLHNSVGSVLDSLSSVVGSTLFWASDRRDFSFGVNMGLDSIP